MKLLVTPRLLMRPFAESDLDDLAALYANPFVMRYIGRGTILSRQESLKRLKRMIGDLLADGFGMLAVIERKEKRLVGCCGLRKLDGSQELELGFLFEERSWGKGFATEAAKEVMRYAFSEMKLGKLVALIHPLNLAARRVLEKLGMKYIEQSLFEGIECLKYELSNTFTKPFAYTSKLSSLVFAMK